MIMRLVRLGERGPGGGGGDSGGGAQPSGAPYGVRLLDEAIHRDVSQVAEALEWLVAEGFVVRESLSGGLPVFSLNRRNAADARRLLTKAVRRSVGAPS